MAPPVSEQPRRSRRNSTRDREKAELAALRRLAAELNAHLSGLKSAHSSAVRPASGAWRRVAERQRLATCAAERRNRRLMALAQRNTEWVERLWELLRETRGPRRQLPDSAPISSSSRDAAVFRRLKSDAELAGCRATDVFAAQGVRLRDSGVGTTIGEAGERWAFATDVASGSCRLIGVRHVPFDLLATSEAVWAALATPFDQFCSSMEGGSTVLGSNDGVLTGVSSVLQTAARSHDAYAAKLIARLPLDDAGERSCRVENYIVVEKLREEDSRGRSSLFVWRMLSSTGGQESSYTVEYNDVMWVAVSSHPGSGLESTIAVVAHAQVHSVGSERAAEFDDVKRKFQTAMLGEVEPCTKVVLDMAENSLVDGAMGRHLPADTVVVAV